MALHDNSHAYAGAAAITPVVVSTTFEFDRAAEIVNHTVPPSIDPSNVELYAPLECQDGLYSAWIGYQLISTMLGTPPSLYSVG